MDLKETLNQAMLAITTNQPLPVAVAKKLVAEVCLYRSKALYLEQVIIDSMKNITDTTSQVSGLIKKTGGFFRSEDDIYLQAYVYCSGKRLPTMKLSKEHLVLVPGGRRE